LFGWPREPPKAAPTEESTLPDLPQCEDVWVVGQKLPEDYRGCIDRTGEGVPLTFINCGGGSGWGDEYLYWYEDGPLSYVAWSAEKHDYPVEWEIEDGNEIGKSNGKTILDTSLDVCRS
jgi:hypothetical protein